MKHLYFCRHGLSQLNADGRWAGRTETPLTEAGKQQAELAGRAAKELHIDYIICSPLQRAHDTARIIARHIGYPEADIDVNSLVLERHFGSMEGQPWQPDFDMDGIADAETTDSLLNRARLTLKHIQTIEADTVLVVSHGAFGRALRHVACPKTPLTGGERFENAKIVKLL